MKEVLVIFTLLILSVLPIIGQAENDIIPPQENIYSTENLKNGERTNVNFSNYLTVRTNLLRWATLTPDIGLEWHFDKKWSALVNGSWTSWRWNDKQRRYALWEVSPEIRYYINTNNTGYIGTMYKIGEFNYKLGDYGRQGKLNSFGLSTGYILKFNRLISLDFGIGAGFIHAKYDNNIYCMRK